MLGKLCSGRTLNWIAAAVLGLGCLKAVPAQAQTLTVLDNFTGAPQIQTSASMALGRDGNYYGGSYYGGTNNQGAIFKLTPSGTVSVIYSLTSADGGPTYPNPILGSDGNFYGTSSQGNAGNGYVFKFTPSGTFTHLHEFSGSDGSLSGSVGFAGGILQGTNGDLYGITSSGGANGGGTFYQITTGGTLTTIYNFSNASGSTAWQPYGITEGTNGVFYGVALNPGAGVFFSLTKAGVLTVLHDFNDDTNGGYSPSGLLQGFDGNFYGITITGGTNNEGTVYKMTPSGTVTILHNFNQSTDQVSYPQSTLLQAPNGNFYSAIVGCNFGGCANDGGIFEITPAGAYTTLETFDGTNGSLPWPGLNFNPNGDFYGITNDGGSSNDGVYYKLSVGLSPYVYLLSISGDVGSKVQILGNGFSSSSVVKFNGVAATTVTRTGTTFLDATVPTGASSGYVTVTTGSTTLTSQRKYTVHNSWANGAAMPVAAEAAAAVAVGSNIYVVGGYNSTGYLNNTQVYSTTTNKWTTGGALPAAIRGGAIAEVKGLIYFIGGYNSSGSTNAVYIYSPVTKKWTTGTSSMPTTRGDAAAAVENNIIYVIGGSVQFQGERLNTVESYNPATNTWKEESPMLDTKSEPAVGVIGTTIVSADGYNPANGDTGDNEAYDVATNSWSALTPDPESRDEACSAAIGGNLYVSGGVNSGNENNSAEAFTLSSNKWTSLTTMPQWVTYGAGATEGGQLYCFGGGNNNQFGGQFYTNVQIYQP
jgi:uncharacterized repeat protein (TIGR03803 family)